MSTVAETSEKIGQLLANVRTLMEAQRDALDAQRDAKDDRDEMGRMLGSIHTQLSDARSQLVLSDAKTQAQLREFADQLKEMKDEVDLLKPLRARMTQWTWVSAGVGLTLSILAGTFARQLLVAKERLIDFMFGAG